MKQRSNGGNEPKEPPAGAARYLYPIIEKSENNSKTGAGDDVDRRTDQDAIALEKTLELHNAVALIMGVIIGSGIFVTPKGVLQDVGSPLGALIIWLLCGLVSTIGAICYSELGSMIQESGGDYAYIKTAFGEKSMLYPFTCLWGYVMLIYPCGNAILALTFAEYLMKTFIPDCENPMNDKMIGIVAGLTVVGLTGLNCVSQKLSNIFQTGATVGKVLALLLIIVVGVLSLFGVLNDDNTNFNDRGSMGSFVENTSTDPSKWVFAFYQGIFSFSGWNALNFLTEELKCPEKNLKRAVYISIPAVTLIYFLTNFSYFVVLSVNQILSSNAVAQTFAQERLGDAGILAPIFVAVSTVGALNGCIQITSRLFFAGARDELLPQFLSFINFTQITPVPALIAQAVVTLFFIFLGESLYDLVNYTSFCELSFVFLTIAALLYLRKTQPETERPVRVNTFIAVVFLIVMGVLILIPLATKPMSLLWGIVLMLISVPVYLLFIWLRKVSESYQRSINQGMNAIQEYVQLITLSVPERDSVSEYVSPVTEDFGTIQMRIMENSSSPEGCSDTVDVEGEELISNGPRN